ncbi:MAG: anti-sigma factor family protein [Candidatus Zixiibacteriota bacterium]
MRHLSDELIQNYLDSSDSGRLTEIENHLAVCFECQEKLAQYQELYHQLSVDTVPVPDDSLNLMVLAEIERLESKKVSKKLIISLSAIGSIAAVMLALPIFGVLNWTSVLESIKSIATTLFSPLFGTIGLLADKLNGNLELLCFAGIALLVFQLLDYGIVKQKAHRV